MNKREKTLLGFVIVVVGATADVTGLGGHPGFGPQQISMIVVGAFIGVAGVVLWLWKRER